MKDQNRAKEILHSRPYTCVMCHGDTVYTSMARGVRPLVAWLESGVDLGHFCAADKVVGRATAFLYVMLGVKAVYAQVISRSARQVLTDHHIECEYGELVDNIINRQGDGICPFEAAVMDVVDPVAAYQIIRQKMEEMNITI